LGARNQVYRQRRDAVLDGLRDLELSPQTPRASLYVWSPIPPGWDCVEFVSAALEGAHVSLTPGTVFGSGGDGYVRIALTAPVERVQEAMGRLKEWLEV
jgi:LL-diaminopimelate aminotransferase